VGVLPVGKRSGDSVPEEGRLRHGQMRSNADTTLALGEGEEEVVTALETLDPTIRSHDYWPTWAQSRLYDD
jgi:hypothetical protein